jgi:hypothetical protein
VTRYHARRFTALALTTLLACAGASTEPATPAKSVLAGSAVQDVLILPLNVASKMPPDLVEASPVVWDALEVYLRAHGMRLRTVNYETARQFWLGSIQQLRAVPGGEKAGYDEASRIMVGKLARHASFDTVLAPSLYIAQAPIEEKSASWDGVERAVPLEARSLAAKAVAEGVPLEGLAPAASLHMVVFDAEGNKIQEGRGGLDLLVKVRVKQNPYGPSDDPVFRFTTRRNPFDERANVREGIALSLSPFLPPLLPRKTPDAEGSGGTASE